MVDQASLCNCCKTSYTLEAFRALRLVGYSDAVEREDSAGTKLGGWERLEMRDCACLSTLAIWIPIEEPVAE